MEGEYDEETESQAQERYAYEMAQEAMYGQEDDEGEEMDPYYDQYEVDGVGKQ